jgi:hypothetical protein
MSMIKHVLLALLLVAATQIARADSWAEPTLKVVASENAMYVARIEPGHTGRGSAHATLYLYDAGTDGYRKLVRYALQDNWLPVTTLLSNDGTLVTLDHWAEVGEGMVLHVYDLQGNIRSQHTLRELIGDAAGDAPSSVSSTWWRCGSPYFTDGGQGVRIETFDEGSLDFALANGTWKYSPGKGSCR